MSDWTFEILKSGSGGALSSGPVAQFGIGGIQRSLYSQESDSLTFSVAENIDAAEWLPAKSIVRISKDGVGFFFGRVLESEREYADNGDQIASYKVAGPWWYMQQVVFQQDWKFWAPKAVPTGTDFEGLNELVSIPISHLILNTDNLGLRYKTKIQIRECVNYCASIAQTSEGLPVFVLDENDIPDIQIPIEDSRDLTCAEVVVKQLRWMPNVVTWFDYSTSPPTLRIKPRDLLTVQTITAGTGKNLNSARLKARTDLLVHSVSLKFEQVSTSNGVPYKRTVVDTFPIGSTPGVSDLVATIDLEGGNTSVVSQRIVTAPIRHGTADWWKTKHPWLAEATVQNVVIDQNSLTRTKTLPNEVISGSVADWMGGSTDEDTVSALVSYNLKDGPTPTANPSKDVPQELVSARIRCTTLASGTYRTIAEYEPGEGMITGLAAWLYSCLSVLHYDGSISLVDQDVPGIYVPGCVVNISGARSEWRSMNAVVQSVTENLDLGITQITVGVPRHLGYEDILQLLRMNRFRRVTNGAARGSGKSIASGESSLPDNTPRENSTANNQAIDRQVIGGWLPDGSAGLIDINKDDLKSIPRAPDGLPAKFRKYLYNEADASGSCVQYEVWLLGTEKRKVDQS